MQSLNLELSELWWTQAHVCLYLIHMVQVASPPNAHSNCSTVLVFAATDLVVIRSLWILCVAVSGSFRCWLCLEVCECYADFVWQLCSALTRRALQEHFDIYKAKKTVKTA